MILKTLELITRGRNFIVALINQKKLETELQREIDHHIELETERNLTKGMAPKAARNASIRSFGSILRHTEDCRSAWGVRILDNFVGDIRFGLRQLAKRKINTFIIISTLAVCLGVNATTYHFYQKLIVNPFDYVDSSKIYKVGRVRSNRVHHTSVPMYLQMKESCISFESLGLVDSAVNFDLTIGGRNSRLSIDRITHEIWGISGVQPLVGQFFDKNRIMQSSNNVVVLSEKLWNRLKSGGKDPLGTQLLLNGKSYKVIGVAPKSFYLGFSRSDAWIPWEFSSDELAESTRNRQGYWAIGKLRSDISYSQAKQNLNRAYESYLEKFPQDREDHEKRGDTYGLVNINHSMIQYFPLVGIAFRAMVFITSLVLVIGCLNVGGLFVMMHESRAQEYAMRRALGASIWRLTRQISSEIVLCFLIGGTLSIYVLHLGFAASDLISMNKVPWVENWDIELPILVYTFLGTLFCGIITSVFPIVSTIKRDLLSPLKQGSGTLSGSTLKQKRLSLYVIFQIAASVFLILATMIAALNLKAVLAKDIGFETENRVAIELQYPVVLPEGDNILRSTDAIIESIQHIPGVINASSSSKIPIDFRNINYTGFSVPKFESAEPSTLPVALTIHIRPNYFRTIGSEILEGREFDAMDQLSSEGVVIINKSIRKDFFKRSNAIGSYLKLGEKKFRIVGIANQIQEQPFFLNFGSDFSRNYALYFPDMGSTVPGYSSNTVVIHTDRDPTSFHHQFEKSAAEIDPRISISTTNFRDTYHFATIAQQVPMKLALFFASIAVLLSCLGLYGFMSHTVVERTKEFGIRLALGAKPSKVFRMVVLRSGQLVIWGLGIGLVLAYLACMRIDPILPDVDTLQVGPFLLVSGIIFFVSFVACFFPAKQAMKINIVEILKHD